MDWKAFKDWLLIGFIGGASAVALNILGQINLNMTELNAKIAVVISKQENVGIVVIDHESRIRELEKTTADKRH
jgi:hypothetical protein